MTNGKWIVSSDEEIWTHEAEFDTPAEAAAYALGEFADDYGIEPDHRVWVGRVAPVSLERMARAMIDVEAMEDRAHEYLFENVGEDFADAFGVPAGKEADLRQTLVHALSQWLADNDVKPGCFCIEDVRSYVVTEREPTFKRASFTGSAGYCIDLEPSGDHLRVEITVAADDTYAEAGLLDEDQARAMRDALDAWLDDRARTK